MFLFGALLLLILPLKWLFSLIFAAAVHELFHYGAILLCGGRVRHLKVDMGGMLMEIAPMPPQRELLCALAGPAGSFLLASLIHRFPVLGLCALVQGMFNLLPVYPLDGGRVAACAMDMLFPQMVACKVSAWIGRICLAVLFLIGIWASLCLSLGMIPVLVPILLWMRVKRADNV